MKEEGVIPTSYSEWRHCIEVLGGILLTSDYIAQRISALEDRDLVGTREFERCYGTGHLERTVAWFRLAAQEVS